MKVKSLFAVMIVFFALSILNLCLGIKSNVFVIASLIYVLLSFKQYKMTKVDFVFIVCLCLGAFIGIYTMFNKVYLNLNNWYSVFLMGFLLVLFIKKKDNIQ